MAFYAPSLHLKEFYGDDEIEHIKIKSRVKILLGPTLVCDVKLGMFFRISAELRKNQNGRLEQIPLTQQALFKGDWSDWTKLKSIQIEYMHYNLDPDFAH
jgi:hypothetical protein